MYEAVLPIALTNAYVSPMPHARMAGIPKGVHDALRY